MTVAGLGIKEDARIHWGKCCGTVVEIGQKREILLERWREGEGWKGESLIPFHPPTESWVMELTLRDLHDSYVHTGLSGGLQHLKIETSLINEMFPSVMGVVTEGTKKRQQQDM
jgi:hypothetical protein